MPPRGQAPHPGGEGRAAIRILLLLAAAVAVAACSDPARDRFEKAEKALLEQRMEAALSGYRSIPKDFPQSRYAPTALLRQGELFGSYYRNYPAALEAYESLVFNYPRAAEVPRALLRQGEIHLLQFLDSAAAVTDLEMAHRQFPRFEAMDEVLLLLARAYAGVPDPARQVAALTELMASRPDSSRAREGRWMLAFALLGQKKYSEADREFRKILYMATDKKDAARARWGMGQALEGEGDLRGALSQYEAIGPDADDPPALEEKISRLKKRLRAP